MTRRRTAGAMIAGALTAIGACQSTAAPRAAVLVRGDAETMAQLKKTLARAVGRAQVDLGPSDPLRSSMITVLPPPPGPYEDRSRALPKAFRIELVGDRCFVVQEDTDARYALDGVACRPL